MKNIKNTISVILLTFIFLNVAYALPSQPYAPWRVDCLSTNNQTITHPNGTLREVNPSETWGAELQNNNGLQISSARCWCKSNVQHEWDTEALGPGNGWWTFIAHLVSAGQTCFCPEGQSIMIEMDHHTCSGTEEAEGFFHCSGCPESSTNPSTGSTTDNNEWVPWVAGTVGGIAGATLTSAGTILLFKYCYKPRSIGYSLGVPLVSGE